MLSSGPGVRKALEERHQRYREAAALLATPPGDTRVSVVRPSRPLGVGRTTQTVASSFGYREGSVVALSTRLAPLSEWLGCGCPPAHQHLPSANSCFSK
jgi:hypothetical protein